MKRFFRIMTIVAIAATLCACSDDEEPVAEPQLDVTPNNLAGTWTVSVWNGNSLDEDCYVYLVLTRKDRLMELYQNVDSFSSRYISGVYNVYTDEELGAVIFGNYDHGIGDWSHRYVVRELTASRMTWVATDDDTLVTVYDRVEALPDELAGE